jgi:dephospho-CoA kinase
VLLLSTVINWVRSSGFHSHLLFCFLLAGHKAYEPGQEAYIAMVAEFGEGILNAETKMIDRVKLGSCVFSDPVKRQRLNDIVWPAVANLAKAEVERLKCEGLFLSANH